MTEARPFRRGDIVLVVSPFITDPSIRKTRPAVIVQNDVGNRFSPNLIVAAISTQIPTRRYPTNRVVRHGSREWEGTGLDRDSAVQTENILTIPKATVIQRLGRFSEGTMGDIDACLRVSLGLGR